MYKLIIILSCLSLQACAIWPYRSDFDCEIPKGLHCKSLYQINRLADEGYFDPNGPDVEVIALKSKLCCR